MTINSETFDEAEARRFQEEIERLIDSSTLCGVVEIVGMICREKAQHIRENWQDEHTANCWDRAADRVEHLTTLQDIRRV